MFPGAGVAVPAIRPEWRETAPAKVNLALHVTSQRADGYHTLSSLVAFAEHGDELILSSSDTDSLLLSGPFAEALRRGASDGDNIVSKALVAARTIVAAQGYALGPLSLTLDKLLPVASGIGGGSADAAALLRVVAGMFPACTRALRIAALKLGADVPMCFDGVPARVENLYDFIISNWKNRNQTFEADPFVFIFFNFNYHILIFSKKKIPYINTTRVVISSYYH